MKDTQIKKAGWTLWLCLGLTLLWTAFIFLHSLQTGEDSAKESGAVWAFLSEHFPFLSHTLVRKLGHLFEFTVLGCLLAALFRTEGLPGRLQKLPDGLRHFMLPGILGLLVACCDEWIQTGVPGREGKVTDVLIDLTGVLLGSLIAGLIASRFRRRRSR